MRFHENGGAAYAAPENREQRTERPCGATGEVFTGGVSRRPASPASPVSPVRPWVSHGTSQTCLRVQGVFPPAGAWGSAPHPPINQSAKSFVSLAVEGLVLWACTVSVVISNYSGSPACGSTPLICSKSVQSAVPILAVFVSFVFLCALCGSRAASGFIAAKGGGSGFNLRAPPNFQASKLPNLQSIFVILCVHKTSPETPND